MRDARHFSGDGAEGLALAIRVLRIALDISGIFLPKRILPHPHRALGRHPEGIAQPSIAVLREPTRPAELPRLLRAKIQAAELHKLAVVREAPQIARFRQNREGENRPDAGQRAEPLIVRMGLRA